MFWYEEEVRSLEKKVKSELTIPPKAVFYGSSTIRLWDTLAQDFPDIPTLNLGFGGSTLAACAWYFERIVVPAQPNALIFYAGDNDLGNERHPEEVYLFFCTLLEKLRLHFPSIPFTFISIKPSPARWYMADRIRFTNDLIATELAQLPNNHYLDVYTHMLGADGLPRKELFAPDGLHLSPEGYQVWQEVLIQAHTRIFNHSINSSPN
jgi:lysophospholipase L1-like esterase